VEVVTARLSAIAGHTPPALPSETPMPADASVAQLGLAEIWFADGAHDTALYEREWLRAGMAFAGPAVVYQYDTTTLIPPGWTARVDGRGNLILDAA
jgi:N-methylhydantoinase A